jgi:hypothetical protein
MMDEAGEQCADQARTQTNSFGHRHKPFNSRKQVHSLPNPLNCTCDCPARRAHTVSITIARTGYPEIYPIFGCRRDLSQRANACCWYTDSELPAESAGIATRPEPSMRLFFFGVLDSHGAVG